MEVPLTENTIMDICCYSNNWISQMDYKPLLSSLIDSSFIFNTNASKDEPLYSITPNGRVCLADFYIQIPITTREAISQFVKKNQSKYKKRQEFKADYYMNNDGTYTVYLKIIEPSQPLLEVKLVVPNKRTAKDIYKRWEDKAANLYELIYDNLVD